MQASVKHVVAIKGKKTVAEFHRELGLLLWDKVGMARNETGLKTALTHIPELRKAFWQNVLIPSDTNTLNKNLEFAGRVADYLELAELMARDALHRNESCGGHFREEHQTKDGEALRNDEQFSYVAAWEYAGAEKEPVLHQEILHFENLKPTQRSYQ